MPKPSRITCYPLRRSICGRWWLHPGDGEECDGPGVREEWDLRSLIRWLWWLLLQPRAGHLSRERDKLCEFWQLLALDAVFIWGVRTCSPYLADLPGILERLWGGSKLGVLQWNFPPCLALLPQHNACGCSQKGMWDCVTLDSVCRGWERRDIIEVCPFCSVDNRFFKKVFYVSLVISLGFRAFGFSTRCYYFCWK